MVYKILFCFTTVALGKNHELQIGSLLGITFIYFFALVLTRPYNSKANNIKECLSYFLFNILLLSLLLIQILKPYITNAQRFNFSRFPTYLIIAIMIINNLFIYFVTFKLKFITYFWNWIKGIFSKKNSSRFDIETTRKLSIQLFYQNELQFMSQHTKKRNILKNLQISNKK